MSFNIGANESRYVVVSNVTMRFSFSDRVLFADLRTSRKTGKPKVNRETGEIVLDANGKPVAERTYTRWQGRFVGNAFEPAKALRNGQAINIINGWVDREDSVAENGQRYVNVFAVITDFTLSDGENTVDEDVVDVEAVGKAISDVSDAFRMLNNDTNTPSSGGRV